MVSSGVCCSTTGGYGEVVADGEACGYGEVVADGEACGYGEVVADGEACGERYMCSEEYRGDGDDGVVVVRVV